MQGQPGYRRDWRAEEFGRAWGWWMAAASALLGVLALVLTLHAGPVQAAGAPPARSAVRAFAPFGVSGGTPGVAPRAPQTGAVWCVDPAGGPTGGAPCTNPTAIITIAAALAGAANGDEIRIAAGTYTGSGTAVAPVSLSLTLTGGYPGGIGGWTTPGAETLTVLDGQNARPALRLTTVGLTVVAQNLTAANGGILLDQCCNTLNANLPLRTDVLDQALDTVGGSAPISVTGVFTWGSGIQRGPGRTAVLVGGRLSIGAGASADSSRTIDNFGDATWTAAGSWNLSNATFTNQAGGTLTIAGTSHTLGGGPYVFTNLGTITQTATGQTAFNGCQISNGGQVVVQAGQFQLNGGTNTGSFVVAAGARLRTAGCPVIFAPASSLTGAGSFETVSDTAVVSGTFSVAAVLVNGGTLQLDSAGANTASTVQTLQVNSTLQGSRTISVTQALTQANMMSGSGRTAILAGAQGLITGNSSVQGGRILDNYGTLTWSSGSLGSTAGTLRNFGTLVVDASGTAQLANAIALVNAGTLRKVGGNPSTFNGFVTNSGQVAVEGGSLQFGQGDSTGSYQLDTGTTLVLCNCFNHIFEPSSSITGTGRLLVTGSTHVVSGTLGLPLVQVLGGTLQIDSVGANTAVTLPALEVDGTLRGSRTISVTQMLTQAGTLSGSGRTAILAGAQGHITGNSSIERGRTLDNYGTLTWTSGSLGSTAGTLRNFGTLVVDASGTAQLANAIALVNAGTLRKVGGNPSTFNGFVTNSGQVASPGRDACSSGKATVRGPTNSIRGRRSLCVTASPMSSSRARRSPGRARS